MTNANDLIKSVEAFDTGLSMADLQARHPDLARRTAQRWLSQLVEEGRIVASGEKRGRRYFPLRTKVSDASATEQDSFPSFIPLSADSRDIVAYINQPLEARKPVGYQRDFLDGYQPNVSSYFPESLRRQLHKMGSTAELNSPAGTYSRSPTLTNARRDWPPICRYSAPTFAR